MSKFPEKLKELKQELGLSNMKIGKAIGVGDTTVCRWENGKADIKSKELVKLAKFFGVSTDYLVGLED
ncbi:MAG: helix-turn-helix transcriptional regulator [Clostridia bacterium]|nr:helix-turn-helix transcriptional regulator [Clostridia bacterium]